MPGATNERLGPLDLPPGQSSKLGSDQANEQPAVALERQTRCVRSGVSIGSSSAILPLARP